MSKKNPKDKPVSLPGHPRPSSAAWANEAGSLAEASPGFLAEYGATIPVPPSGVVQVVSRTTISTSPSITDP